MTDVTGGTMVPSGVKLPVQGATPAERSRRGWRLSIVPLGMRLLFGQHLLSFAEPEAVGEP